MVMFTCPILIYIQYVLEMMYTYSQIPKIPLWHRLNAVGRQIVVFSTLHTTVSEGKISIHNARSQLLIFLQHGEHKLGICAFEMTTLLYTNIHSFFYTLQRVNFVAILLSVAWWFLSPSPSKEPASFFFAQAAPTGTCVPEVTGTGPAAFETALLLLRRLC